MKLKSWNDVRLNAEEIVNKYTALNAVWLRRYGNREISIEVFVYNFVSRCGNLKFNACNDINQNQSDTLFRHSICSYHDSFTRH